MNQKIQVLVTLVDRSRGKYQYWWKVGYHHSDTIRLSLLEHLCVKFITYVFTVFFSYMKIYHEEFLSLSADDRIKER